MKKYLFTALIAFAAIALSACKEDEGTDPGTDGAPTVTFYTYDAPSGTDADQTVSYRIVPNNKVAKMYLLTDTQSDKEAFIATNGEKAYTERVVSTGTEYKGEDLDIVIQNLVGLNTTTVVAEAANGSRKAYENVFKGVIWVDAGEAQVYQNFAHDGTNYLSGKVKVQRQSDNNICRVTNLFGQLNSSIGSATNILTFTFNSAKECTAFATSRAPYVMVGFKDADGEWYGYYDAAKYGSYCSVTNDSDEEGTYVYVSMLKLDNAAGKLYTGGYIYLYTDTIDWYE